MTTERENDAGLLLHAYLDGELDPAHAMEMERRLAEEPALAAERERMEALRRVIKERLPRIATPPGLAARIEAEIARTVEPQLFGRVISRGAFFRRRASQADAPGAIPSPIPPGPSWRALAASVLLTAFVATGATWSVLRPEAMAPSRQGSDSADAVADMVVASHIRSLMAPQPADVPSSDRHTVKPWFNGRVSEAPRVVDLGSEGFPLVGGRVDVIGRTPVPTLVYRRRQHLISLLAVPDGEAAVPALRNIAGYNVLTWKQNGIVYWVVSDVAAADLEQFAAAFRNAAG